MMTKHCYKFFFYFFFSIFSIPLFAAVTVADFARFDEFDDVRISPDGRYLAAGMNDKAGNRSIVIIDMKSKKVTARSSFSSRTRPGDFFWANKKRLIIALRTNLGYLDYPISTGELYAVNADGKQTAMIFGYRANARKSERVRAGATLLDVVKDDPKNILVTVIPFRKHKGSDVLTQVNKLNIYTGKTKRVALTPIRNGELLADHNQQVRLAIGTDSSSGNRIRIFYRKDKTEDYEILGEYNRFSGGVTYPLRFTADNKKIYILSNIDRDTFGLYLLDPKTGDQKLIASKDDIDLDYTLFDNNDHLIAAAFYDDKPQYEFVGDSKLKKSIRGLVKAFKGNQVEPLNISWDDRYITLKVSNDRNPGDFYLYDTKTHKASFLLAARSWQDPQTLRPVKPVNFTASDGQEIHGYLTLPETKGPYPLVIHPHGGPFGIRDYWKYDSIVQMLAKSGYAVLQVNYRGSGGYGKNFQKLGIGQWGSDMQQDLTDATGWAIEEGITSPEKVCIFGGSYGGYASLMGVVNEPDLYQCAIGYAGIYDLNLMFEEGDISWNSAGINYLETALGKDAEIRAERSPANHAENIKAAIFLAHGGEDDRTPIEQYEAMESALNKAKKPFKSLIFKKEGHGFFKQENREKFYSMLLEFLDEHIGSK
jgi:dipeptidyl aminopeptidase/acylaminoacyl peptidase